MRHLIDLIEKSMLVEQKLTVQNEGMGLKTLYNDEIALSGGMRSGSSPGHFLRTMYVIYDLEILEKEGQQAAECGKVEVWENQEGIHGLVNIEIDKDNRKAGIGRKVVQALVDNCDNHFAVSDIRKKAVGFWQKMGCHFFLGNREISKAEMIKKAHATFTGVIPKAGCSDPIGDYCNVNSTKWRSGNS